MILRLAAILLAHVSLAGCAHYADDSLPFAGELPLRWAAEVDGMEIDGTDAQAQGATTVQWWKSYHDPALDTLVAEAVARNTDLRLAAERVVQAEAARRGTGAQLLPDSSMEISIDNNSGGYNISRRDNAFAGFNLLWQPDFSGGLSAAWRAAQADTQASVEDADTVRHLLIATVVQTYVDYRLQRDLLRLAQETVRTQEDTLRITRDRYELGILGNLEVQRAQVLVSQTQAALAQARSNAEAARFRLATLLATTPDALSERLGQEDTGIPAADSIPLLNTPAAVLALRPDVRAAQARYRAAAARRQVADAAYWPTLSLSGLLGWEGATLSDILEGSAASTRTLSSGLLAPLFSFGRLEAQSDAASSELRQAELVYEQTARTAMEETQTALIAYVEQQKRLAALNTAATAAQKASGISLLQYRQGVLSQLEVLDAARIVYDVEQEEAQAKAQVAVAVANVYWSMAVTPSSGEKAEPLESDGMQR